jgi:hypothetical protein
VRTRPPFECIALLLQGGGALGAYQAGVYQALAEADIHPDWVAGISIGAINSAIIAGNPPEERVAKLRAFWEGITTNPLFDWTAAADRFAPKGDIARSFFTQMSAAWALVGGAPGFFTLRQPAARVHHAARWRGGSLAAPGARAAERDAGGRVSPQWKAHWVYPFTDCAMEAWYHPFRLRNRLFANERVFRQTERHALADLCSAAEERCEWRKSFCEVERCERVQ